MPPTRHGAPTVLDVAGACAYLAISKDQVYRLARLGELPHARVGRGNRFRIDDLDDYLQQQPTRSGRARRAREDLPAKAFLASPQPMSISTLAEGRFINVNDSFLDLTG